jgi:hypothetical protein
MKTHITTIAIILIAMIALSFPVIGSNECTACSEKTKGKKDIHAVIGVVMP